MRVYKAPFPWFGGKSKVAGMVWDGLGDVENYVEPFFGSGAVLLGRPHGPQTETINDKDGFVSNAWRSIQAEPEAVAYYADNPVNECDLHARHIWLVGQRELLSARLEGDPDYYDPIIAGYWLWGVCCWIGSGFCSGEGPWHSIDGKLVKIDGDAGLGVSRKRVHLNDRGRGVNRQLVHLRNKGMGVNRAGLGERGLGAWMQALCDRLRLVRVCCGDWTRVLTPSVTTELGVTGVFLDPPYAHSERRKDLYSVDDDISRAVYKWAVEHGENPEMKIVLCGYEGEHEMPETWRTLAWETNGGYGNLGEQRGKANGGRERLWLSPYCLETHSQCVFLF